MNIICSNLCLFFFAKYDSNFKTQNHFSLFNCDLIMKISKQDVQKDELFFPKHPQITL